MKVKHLLALIVIMMSAAGCRAQTKRLYPQYPNVVALYTGHRPGSLVLNGRWLVWNEIDDARASKAFAETPVVVYDLEEQRRLPDEVYGVPLAVEDNQLFLGKWAIETPTVGDGLRKIDVWVLDLESHQERLVYADLDNMPLYGIQTWTDTPFPDQCMAILDCGEAFYAGCGVHITVHDMQTNEGHDLGIWSQGTRLIDISTGLALLVGGQGICPVKYYPSTFYVVDLQSGEYRILDWGAYMLGAYAVIAGRTVAYTDGVGHTAVLQIEPTEPTQVLLNVQGIQVRALISPNIMLYTPISDERNPSGPNKGLAVIDFRSGQYQEIDTETYVRSAVGDATHVAWISQDDRLFVSELHLLPSNRPAFLDAPVPTVDPSLALPMATWEWKAPTRPAWLNEGTPTP